MFTIEELQKDLEIYTQKQAELREHFANLTGAIQLLKMQIAKLEETSADKGSEEA
jgi:hypothetical protein